MDAKVSLEYDFEVANYLPIIVFIGYITSSETEVRNFHRKVGSNENISGSKITVDETLLL